MSELQNDKAYFIDLLKIRKHQGLSDEEISSRTLITLDIIQAFEETGLLNHPRFNRVYLRALVQSYADALNVDHDLARRALDETIAGVYDGFLVRKYIEGKSISDTAPAPPPKPADSKEAARKNRPLIPAQDSGGAVRISRTSKPSHPVTNPPPKQRETPPEKPRSDIRSAPPATKEPFRLDKTVAPVPRKPDQVRPNVFKLEEPTPARSERQKPEKEPISVSASSPVLKLGTIAGIVIILAVATWFALDYISRPPEPTRLIEEPVQGNESGNGDLSDDRQVQEPVFVLPDSVRLVVVAARGTLSPVSVTIDGEEYLRWVEARDSVSFYASSGFTLSGGSRTLSRIDLRVQGYAWELPQSDTLSTYSVTRDEIQSRLSSR